MACFFPFYPQSVGFNKCMEIDLRGGTQWPVLSHQIYKDGLKVTR